MNVNVKVVVKKPPNALALKKLNVKVAMLIWVPAPALRRKRSVGDVIIRRVPALANSMI